MADILANLLQTQKLINEVEKDKWLHFYYGRFFTGSITFVEGTAQGSLYFHDGQAYACESGLPLTGIDVGISGSAEAWDHFKERRRSVNIGSNKAAATKRGWNPAQALSQLGSTLRLRQAAAPLAEAARLYSYAREGLLPSQDPDLVPRDTDAIIPDVNIRGFYVRVRGVKIYCETNDGPDDQLTLIFLPTAGRDGRQYHDLMALFGKKYKIVVLDLPGHGKSWPLPGNKVINEFHEYGDWVWEIISALNIKNPMTCGCSMAGCIQYYLAQNYPVRAICCMQGVEDTAGQTDTRVTDMLWHPLVSCQHSHLELTESLIGRKTSLARQEFIYWGVLQETGITKQGDYLELLSFDVKDHMEKIACPVLIIEGMDDQSYTPYMTEQSKKRLVNSKYVELCLIEGYGHFIAVESPETVYKLLNEFIESHVLKDSPARLVVVGDAQETHN
jgi:pimeloyl-ACP methyl ester carboxylesterase